jgi:16S rRNA (guanine527-N7)-methyltransferase
VIEQDGNSLESLLRTTAKQTGASFSEAEIARFLAYYRIVLKWNPRLHLTTLTSPYDFLHRHILESCFLASRILPSVKQVWDIGSGLGIPGMVIAIRRPDLQICLVESSRKKSVFLEEAAMEIRLSNVKVIEGRFESLETLPTLSCLTARAMEGMESMIPKMGALAASSSQILLLGSERLEELILTWICEDWVVKKFLIPTSDRRYLIEANRST